MDNKMKTKHKDQTHVLSKMVFDKKQGFTYQDGEKMSKTNNLDFQMVINRRNSHVENVWMR